MSTEVITGLIGLICGLVLGGFAGLRMGRGKGVSDERGRRSVSSESVVLPGVGEGVTPDPPRTVDEGPTPNLPGVPDEGVTPDLPNERRRSDWDGTSVERRWLTEDGPELPVSGGALERRVTCTMSAHGRVQTQAIDPGFVWAQADQPGLAVDMHANAAFGTTPMVSVRMPDDRAFLEVSGVQIRLSPISVPWRGGVVVNGDWRFTLDAAVGVPEIRVHEPRTPHRLVACPGLHWVAFSDEQPHLAAVAAQLYAPEGLDPVGEWRERLTQYCESVGYGEVRVSLLVLDRDGVTVTGPVVGEIGVGTFKDSLPGSIRAVPQSGELAVATAQRVWVPTALSSSQDRYHQAFVVERVGTRELVPGSDGRE